MDSLNVHMTNLATSVLFQTTASNDANMAISALMNQVPANETQCNNDHNRMMQQFPMLLTVPTAAPQFAGLIMGQQAGWPQAATQHNFIPQAIPILALAQQWASLLAVVVEALAPKMRGPAQQRPPIPFNSGNQMILYIPVGMHPTQHQNLHYSNVVKQWANQNVCFSCGFGI